MVMHVTGDNNCDTSYTAVIRQEHSASSSVCLSVHQLSVTYCHLSLFDVLRRSCVPVYNTTWCTTDKTHSFMKSMEREQTAVNRDVPGRAQNCMQEESMDGRRRRDGRLVVWSNARQRHAKINPSTNTAPTTKSRTTENQRSHNLILTSCFIFFFLISLLEHNNERRHLLSMVTEWRIYLNKARTKKMGGSQQRHRECGMPLNQGPTHNK